MPEYECIVNPHDAVGRTRSPATGRAVAAIAVTVIALSALACLAFPIGQGAAPTALAAAQAAHPPVRVTSAMQHRLAAARPAPGVSSKRVTTAEQHLAIAKQALEEAPAEEAPAEEAPTEEPAAEETPEEKAPEEEAPAEEAPVAEPAADSAADGDAGARARRAIVFSPSCGRGMSVGCRHAMGPHAGEKGPQTLCPFLLSPATCTAGGMR